MQPAASEWLGASNESLWKVASGLGLIRTGAILIAATLLLHVAVAVFTAFGGVGRATWLFPVSYAVVLIVRIMNVLGGVRCLSMPPELRARRWILAYVVIELPCLFIALADVAGAGSRAPQFVRQLSIAVALATFMMFLRNLGLSLGRNDLARRAIRLLLLWMMVIGIFLAEIAGVHLPLQVDGFWAGRGFRIEAVGVAFLVVDIVASVKNVNLLAAMRSAILTGR
jgi:hypothetical protein